MTKHTHTPTPATLSAPCSKSDMASLLRLPTIDVADRLNAMLDAERQPHYRCRDYLHHRAPSWRQSSSFRNSRSSSRCRSKESTITPASRAKIVKWLYNCVDYLELQRECVAVAMSYVDRFMSSSSNNNKHNNNNNNNNNNISRGSSKHSEVVAEAKRDATVYQLIGISALFLAAKQSDNRASADVDAEVLSRVSHMSYSVDEILDMETTLLDALQWRLCAPTALCVAYHAIGLLAKRTRRRDRADERERRIGSVVDFARLQIELSASDYAISVLRRPSTTALAAVLNSVELLDFTDGEKRSFGGSLLELTRMDVRSEEMEEARKELQRAFDRQSEDVMSRATLSSSTADRSVHTTKSSGSPVDVRLTTPRSSSGRRRKGSRARKPKPSPIGVDARFGKLKLEP